MSKTQEPINIPPAGTYGQPPPYQEKPNQYEVGPDTELGYVDSDGMTGSGFESNDVRRQFVRKVYSILFVLLAFTAAIIAIFILVPDVRRYVLEEGGYWLISTCFGLFFFFYILLVCDCCGLKHRFPVNIVLLFLMAGSMGMSLGATCCFFEFEAIVAAGCGTALVVLAVTLLTFWSKFDITKFTHILFLLPLAFCFTWIWWPIFGVSTAAYYGWMSFACALMIAFLAWDTKVLIGGGRIELSPDDYIIAVIQLYYDIVYIFQYLLILLSRD